MSWNMRARCQAIVSASAGVARRIRNKSDIWTTKTDFSFVTTAKRFLREATLNLVNDVRKSASNALLPVGSGTDAAYGTEHWQAALDLLTQCRSGSDWEMQRSPMATQKTQEKTSMLDLQTAKESVSALASAEAE
jgi:hypothetical protein